MRERAMSPGGCSGVEDGRRLLASPGDGKLRSPGTAPAAAARTRPRFGGRRCQALVPGGLSLPSPLEARLKSSAHRPPKPWHLSVPTKATPPSLGQAAIAASRSQSGPSTSLTRDHAPDPGLSSFLTESRDAELWPRPQRGPAPATPPSDLKRLGLRLT